MSGIFGNSAHFAEMSGKVPFFHVMTHEVFDSIFTEFLSAPTPWVANNSGKVVGNCSNCSTNCFLWNIISGRCQGWQISTVAELLVDLVLQHGPQMKIWRIYIWAEGKPVLFARSHSFFFLSHASVKHAPPTSPSGTCSWPKEAVPAQEQHHNADLENCFTKMSGDLDSLLTGACTITLAVFWCLRTNLASKGNEPASEETAWSFGQLNFASTMMNFPLDHRTVVVKSIHTAGCIKQNGQLLTLANNNLVGSDYQKTTHDASHHSTISKHV